MAHANGIYNTKDLTMSFMCMGERNVGHCLQDLVNIGPIDMNTIGCVACEAVLYLSPVFINFPRELQTAHATICRN